MNYVHIYSLCLIGCIQYHRKGIQDQPDLAFCFRSTSTCVTTPVLTSSDGSFGFYSSSPSTPLILSWVWCSSTMTVTMCTLIVCEIVMRVRSCHHSLFCTSISVIESFKKIKYEYDEWLSILFSSFLLSPYGYLYFFFQVKYAFR